MNEKPRKYERPRTLARRMDVGESTIWQWVAEGRFPRPIKLGPRTTVFDVEAVEEFIAEKASKEASA